MEEVMVDESGPRVAERDARISGMRVGTLVGFRPTDAAPLVIYPQMPVTSALPALAVLDLSGSHVGRSVVLAYENGNPRRPIVMGLIAPAINPALAAAPAGTVEIDADGERLIVQASSELVLRCGRSSITLTRAGKVLIQGDYVSSRSTGVNRIKGGAVELN